MSFLLSRLPPINPNRARSSVSLDDPDNDSIKSPRVVESESDNILTQFLFDHLQQPTSPTSTESSSTPNDLPLDIWLLILKPFGQLSAGVGSHAEINDLLSLSLVCRTWRVIAQRFLLRHLEPRSRHSLKLVLRTLSSPQSTHLAEQVQTLVLPLFRPKYKTSKCKLKWRARPVGHCEHRTVMMISPEDYADMLTLFTQLIRVCPNVTHVSLPMHVSRTHQNRHSYSSQIGFAPQLPFPLHLAEKLKTLVITPVIFGGSGGGSSKAWAKQQRINEDIVLPELTELVMQGVVLSVEDKNLRRFILPKLESITFRRSHCRKAALSGWLKHLQTTSECLKTLKFRQCTFTRRFEFAIENQDLHIEQHRTEPWFLNEEYVADILEGITELSVEALRHVLPGDLDADAPPIPFREVKSLKRLTLSVKESSPIVELRAPPPSISELHLIILNSTSVEYAFTIAAALRLFFRNSTKLAPNLTGVSVYWYISPSWTHREMARVLAFCLQEYAKEYGVSLQIRIERCTDASVHIMKSKEEHALNPRRWGMKQKHPLPLLDRGMAILGWHAW